MNEERAHACVVDRRSWLHRLWHRWTLADRPIDGHLVVNVTCVLGFKDRLLVLLGRDVVVRVESPEEPNLDDPGIYKLIDTLRSSVRTEPRGWR